MIQMKSSSHIKPILLLLFCIVIPTPIYAAPTLDLVELKDTYQLSLYLDILEDKTGELTISDVSKDKWAVQFVPNTQLHPKFDFSKSAYWGRMTIKNTTYQLRWVMEFFTTTLGAIDNIDLYMNDPSGSGEGEFYQYMYKQGDNLFESEKPLRDDNAVFDLHIPAGSEITLYFRIQDEALTSLHLYLYNPSTVFQFNRGDKIRYAAIFSVILFLIFNLLLFLSLKDKVFLFCCLVIISEGLYYILSEMPGMTIWWMNRLRGLVYINNAIAWILVIKVFFQNMFLSKQVNSVLYGFLLLFCVLTVSYFIFPFQLVAKTSAYVFIFYAFMLISLALFCWIKWLKAARYLSICMILLAFCWLGFYLDLLGVISLNHWYLIYLKSLKSIVVFLFFSFALLDRYKLAENKMLENQAAALRRMQQVDQLKDDFLANTSHELRTPLHGIIGLSEDLLAKTTDAVKGEWNDSVSLIIKSGKRLSRLIDDILDFSRIKQNDLSISPKPTDFKSICSLVITLCRPTIGKKNIDIKTNFEEPLPYVMADEDRLQQILLNLLGNAVKFTHKGEIVISARTESDMLRVVVRDTGIGIPKEKIDSIFSEFAQVDGSIQREYGGTGLGLAITKKLIELQGGTIHVESEINKGSSFIFTLPATEKPLPEVLDKINASPRSDIILPEEDPLTVVMRMKSIPKKRFGTELSKKILIVDDDAIGLFTLESHLASVGYAVTAVQDGFEAWEKIQNEKYDMVVLDIMMPRMNGYELCEKIRTLYDLTELPVIMLTAKTQVGDIVQGYDCGANDYVTKPVNRDVLLSRIQTGLQLKQFTDLLRENKSLKDEILKRKRVEKDLVSVNQSMISLLDIWETGIIVVDPHHQIQFVNQRAEELFGRPNHEVYSSNINKLLPDLRLPAAVEPSRQMKVTTTKPDKSLTPIEIIVTPIDVNGDVAYALLCRENGCDPEMLNQMGLTGELSRTHQKIQVLKSAFDSALRFLDQEGKHMESELKHIESSMENEFAKLPEKEIEPLFRQTVVEIMNQTLEAWERTTGKDKVQFAEESALWRVYLDGDAFKTRTLDKYMDIDKLPKNPRWKDVLKSVEFVLYQCPDPNPLKTELQASLSKLRALAKAR